MRPRFHRPAGESGGPAAGVAPVATLIREGASPAALRGAVASTGGRARLALSLVVVAAVAAAGYRMAAGLGAATSLSDAWPWGLWKIVGVVAGIPLAAGAFVIAAWVHVFGKHRYEALARPAVLAGFIGYLTAIIALVVDLGQPLRIWHPIIMWQVHSVLFEVCWCVILYTTVLALEFAPVACAAAGWTRLGTALEHAVVPIATAGATLCVLHQSSLGSLFLIAPSRMSPLWYTPRLPLIFFVSAVAAGLATLQVQAWAATRFYGQPVNEDVRGGLARGLAAVLALYLVVRVADWAVRSTGPWHHAAGAESLLAWTELVLGIVVPLALLEVPALRARSPWRLTAAALTAGGVLLHRLDVGLTSMRQAAWLPYVPSWIELLVMAGMVAAGILAYDWVARHMSLFASHPAAAAE